jgi:dsRNA-specific ribonuclease
MRNYHLLALKLKMPDTANELKKALTHKSFFKKENKERGNSRYVFAGMFAFKGLVAEALFRYLPATGTQLQHILGNVFKNEHLERIFVAYDFHLFIRHSIDFNADKHRHIFVYGLLGCILAHASDEVKNEFIRRHFILPYAHILSPETKKRDMEAQCNLLSKMLYGDKVKLSMQKNESLWTATVTANEHILAVESSSSYRYVRKKTLKKALVVLSEATKIADEQREDYALRRQIIEEISRQKAEAEIKRKQTSLAEKQAQKKAVAEAKKAKVTEQKRLHDLQRKQAKAAAKRRKEEQAAKTAALATQMKNISARKRRHLEDKKK